VALSLNPLICTLALHHRNIVFPSRRGRKMVDIEKLADEWGPEKIVQVYDPPTG